MQKPTLGERLKRLVAEYGRLALVVYFAIFLLVLAGFAITIHFGVSVESAAGTAGTLGAAWVATKVTQPLRIGATLVLTPIVSALVARVRARAAAARGQTPPAAGTAASGEDPDQSPKPPSKPSPPESSPAP